MCPRNFSKKKNFFEFEGYKKEYCIFSKNNNEKYYYYVYNFK